MLYDGPCVSDAGARDGESLCSERRKGVATDWIERGAEGSKLTPAFEP